MSSYYLSDLDISLPSYPYPFVGFAASSSISNTSLTVYGGVRYSNAFFENGALTSDANYIMFLWEFTPDLNNVTCLWFSSLVLDGGIAESSYGNIGNAMVMADSRLVLFGGFNVYASSCVTGLWFTSPISQYSASVWFSSTVPSQPGLVFQSSIAYIAPQSEAGVATQSSLNSWVVFGGQTKLFSKQYPYIWRFIDQKWQNLLIPLNESSAFTHATIGNISSPSNRWGHSAVTLGQGSVMVLFGGGQADSSGGLTVLDEVWLWTPAHPAVSRWKLVSYGNSTFGAPPSPRYLHAASAYNPDNVMFMFGGRGSENSNIMDDLWQWSYSTQTWKSLPRDAVAGSSWPGKRYGHIGKVLISDTSMAAFIVFGGCDGVNVLSDTWIFNIFTMQWTEVKASETSQSPPGRFLSASVTLNYQHTMFIFSGGLGEPSAGSGISGERSVLNDMWLVSLSQNDVQFTPFPVKEGVPPIFAHNLYYVNSSSIPDQIMLSLIGGLTSTGDFSKTPVTIRLGCPPGFASENFPLMACKPCPQGSFPLFWMNSTNGNCLGTCPGASTTRGSGSTSVTDCTECSSSACNNHGTCEVIYGEQQNQSVPVGTSCICSGFFSWSDAQCGVSYIGVVIGSSLGCLFLLAGIVAVRHYLKHLKIRFTEEYQLHERLLEMKDTQLRHTASELRAMERVWVIDHNNLQIAEHPFAVGGSGEVRGINVYALGEYIYGAYRKRASRKAFFNF